ncbi:MAG: hypothetical protein VKO21_02510, partial [Candidatus Sericytochromatia bacterium]|nr:hypothetical protein [Candidatus Sericytochromatia bacterium]
MFVLVACQAAPTTTGANTTATQTRRLALAMRIMGAQASPVFLPADARLTVALFDNGSQPALGRWSAADQSLGPLVPQLIADAASSPLDEPAPGLSNILSALPDAPRPPADIGAAARWWIWRSFLPSVAGASEIRLDISDLRPDPAAGEGSLVLLFLVTDAAGQVLGRAHRWLSAADFPANGPLQVPVDVAVAPDTYVSHPVDLHVQPPSLELQAPTAASSLGSSSLWPSLGGETPMVPQALGEGPGGTVYLISTKLIHQIGDAGLTSMSALLGGVSLVDAELADLVGLADGTFILAIRNTLTNSGRLVHVAASGSVMGTKTQLGDGTPLPRPRSVALRNGRLLFTTDFSLFECDT